MAKSKSLISLQGTFGDVTHVKSLAYGDHVRAPRGTYKTATVNSAFKKESRKLVSCNIPAKIFKDAIDPYRKDMKDGTLWTRLLAMFRKQLDALGGFYFSQIEPFEIDTAHPLGRFLNARTKIVFDRKKSVLKVSVMCGMHPKFNKSSFIDGYRLSVIGLFPDLEEESEESTVAHSKIMKPKGDVDPFHVKLEVPIGATNFIVCLKIEGCIGDIVNNTPATMGLRVIGAGAI